ncbi:excinuclease ABC subunit UvrB [Mycoplasma leonicaptivi]|uniref:excinuclease ABC subunit UvrB n=1 Tax=Mycoplasma leonicaptivi TaxID=36742 RepID=UPI00048725B9|nr:excinuclease ABC subunit UvrB [Mycoplasma leonicaptivi]
MKIFELNSQYKPAGGQPASIEFLVNAINNNVQEVLLEGVTGSGKTFAIANVIKELNRPILLLSHNKTLASQLYSELKEFFPNNAVEYYISYFDYFQPEAYIPSSDTYIEKDSKTNEQIEIMRMSTINSLLNRRDVIVVASVSAIYGALNPEIYKESFFRFYVSQNIGFKNFIYKLTLNKYERNDFNLTPGKFAVKGDVVSIRPADQENLEIRVSFFGEEIEEIATLDALNKNIISKESNYLLSPGDAYAVSNQIYDNIIPLIEKELNDQLDFFKKENKLLEHQRLSQRILNDIHDLKEFKMCKGIENYSMYLDGRTFGQRPYTLLDYFPNDAILVIDESHKTMGQIAGMERGDNARKTNLVEYGFRLPSAIENRPLKIDEFEKHFKFQRIYVSATPNKYELERVGSNLTKMYIRPTGLVDPVIEVKPSTNQIEHIFDTLIKQRENKEKTIILTVTKESAEKLSEYLQKRKIKATYMHSDHKTFERNEIIRKLRLGIYEVIIGVGLLREGIDIPEVSIVMIVDADKGGFSRDFASLVQIVGRASRNANGKAILYADTISPAMEKCIEDNKIKREIQIKFNTDNGIIPQTIIKKINESIEGHDFINAANAVLRKNKKKFLPIEDEVLDIEDKIKQLETQMLRFAKNREYDKAQEIKEQIQKLERG